MKINLTSGTTVLLLGARASILQATAHELAKKGCRLVLAARDVDALKKDAADYHLRYGVEVLTYHFDANAIDAHPQFIQDVLRDVGHLDGVVLGFGYLGDPILASADNAACLRILTINFTAAVAVLDTLAAYLAKQGRGFIVGISSVAADRGRQSNYHYGAAKAGLTTYLQGLRNALFRKGVHVMTVKPGFVDTPMTFGRVQSPLMVSPETVAKDIIKQLPRGKNELYTPWFWRYIMLIIRWIPECVFKRLRL